jgi:O-antigen ligase
LRRNYRLLLLMLTLGLAAQSALTFSRSGVYLAVASGLGACALMARDSRRRTALVGSGLLLYVIVTWVIAPRLNEFTQGQLGARFADVQTTGRAELMKADLLVWRKHPFLGVGPGMATALRAEYGDARKLAAHSEFTRVLSEHGLLGLIALGWLCLAAYRNTMRIRRLETRAIVGGLVAFGLLFLLTNAMRLALCSFMIGLCFADFDAATRVTQGQLSPKRCARRAAQAVARRTKAGTNRQTVHARNGHSH